MSDRDRVTEAKTKASALAVLAVALIGQGVLAGTVTDYVEKLPDAFEVGAYSLILAVIAWLAGWAKSSVAGKLAPSTITAVQETIPNQIRRKA